MEINTIDRKFNDYYICDFETNGGNRWYDYAIRNVLATNVLVWGLCSSSFDKDRDEVIQHGYNGVEEFLHTVSHICAGSKNIPLMFFHNLKYDGSYLEYYLAHNGYAFVDLNGKKQTLNEMEYSYLRSEEGVFYSFKIRFKNIGRKHSKVEFRDSYNFLRSSVDSIGKSFDIGVMKGSIDYDRLNWDDEYVRSREVYDYLVDDLLVVKRALRELYVNGIDIFTKYTINGACMDIYKEFYYYQVMNGENQSMIDYWNRRLEKNRAIQQRCFENVFPKLVSFNRDGELKSERHKHIHDFAHDSFWGGFVHLEGHFKGVELDVPTCSYDRTSAYASELYNELMPIGHPKIIKGGFIDADNEYFYPARVSKEDREIMCEKFINNHPLFIVNFSAKFEVKDNKLHFAKTRLTGAEGDATPIASSDEMRFDMYGNIVTLCMTNIEFELFLEQYDIEYIEINEVHYYSARQGLFNDYVEYYLDKKENNTGAKRTVAKGCLNGLFGTFGKKVERKHSVPNVVDGLVGHVNVESVMTEGEYMPIATFTSAYARCKMVRIAQGLHDAGIFIYADTDSIAIVGESLPESLAKELGIDLGTGLGCWKKEGDTHYIKAKYVKPKMYIRTKANGELEVKASGVNKNNRSKINYTNFGSGSIIENGKKQSIVMHGGICLVDTDMVIDSYTDEDLDSNDKY